MPATGDIVINDGQATPVAHTFSPDTLVNGIQRFEDRSGGIAIGNPSITLNMTKPSSGGVSSKDRKVRTKARIRLPKLEALGTADSGLTPPPTLAYESVVNIDVAIPERADLAHRKDVVAYIANFVAHAMYTAMVENNEPLR